MAKSFSAYASQFLNKQQNGGTSSLASSQPMFFSFTTDDGSRGGHDADSDMDDLDDPHLRASEATRASYRGSGRVEEPDEEDPYLRLDEDDIPGGSQTMPLISSERSPDSPRGWLAHQTLHPSPMRSPSPSASSSSPPPQLTEPPPPPLSTRAPISLSLTESLLPRDGRSRPLDVFSLPDPRHTPRGRRKYNDSIWTAIWCAGVSVCLVSCILVLFLTHEPSKPTRRSILPYTTLLHTVPMLTILTFVSAIVAYGHIFLLRIFVRPVMIATSVFIPATLFISAIWAFVGSFMWDAELEPTWGETVGLRLFSLIPLALSLLTARRLTDLPREMHVTSSMLTLTTRLLMANPLLLGLSPLILLVALLFSIPFLTLTFRLLLVGYFTRPISNVSPGEWHIYAWANWAIAGTVGVWLWSWGVARGVLRTTCASVIGAWYFADPADMPPPPLATHTIHAALFRSTALSLGTTVLGALLLTAVRMLMLVTVGLRSLPLYLPPYLRPVTLASTMAVGVLERTTTGLSRYALIYTGLTGDAFMPSARRARALTTAAEAHASHRRKFKTEPPLTLLTVAPLTLTFPFALTTYLFVAHTLAAPAQALGASVLAGGVTALVGLFCAGLVHDTADTLYICYCIDKDLGERRREEVFAAFEYEARPQVPAGPPRPTASPVTARPRAEAPKQTRRPTPLPPRPEPITVAPAPATPAPAADVDPFSPTGAQPSTPRRQPLPASPRRAGSSSYFSQQQQAAAAGTYSPPGSRVYSPPASRVYSPPGSGAYSPPARARSGSQVHAAPARALQPYSVSPEPGDAESDDDDGSQFFPGSGFF